MILLLAIVLAQTRIASDFELQQMQRQVESAHDFLSQLSGHLNLGDLRTARNEPSLARAEYAKALDIATKQRTDARRGSDLTRYSTATSYAALSNAKLGNAADAFTLSEEAMRYSSESAKSWNLYSSTMAELHLTKKAASAARNAVALATEPLDLAIYKYSLATAIGETPEAEKLLVDVVQLLRSPTFDNLRRQAAREESFEIYSTARGDVAAYVSILNRAQLHLGQLYEDRDYREKALEQYWNVLADRTDDPTALEAIARLDPTDEHDKAAFDANPFSPRLIGAYEAELRRRTPASIQPQTTGDQVRLALLQMHRGENPAAISTLSALQKQFPNNASIDLLLGELLRKRDAFLAEYGNAAELDQRTFVGKAIFDQGPPFETGTIDGKPFRFSEPMKFNGTFAAHIPLRLTYRILGVTQLNGADALLLEPIRLEPAQ